MDILYELAKLNIRNKRLLEAILPTNNDSQIRKLLEILYSGRQLMEVDTMISIYGKINIAAFSRLKYRMKEAFIKAIIFQSTNLESVDQRVNEGLNSYRQTLVSRILLTKRSSKLAVELLERSLIKSMKYHVTESVLHQSRMLVSYYGSTEFNKYKFSKYLEIQQKYMKIYHWEVLAENYFYDLQRIQLQSLANTTEETKRKAFKYATELQSVSDIRSYFFNYNKYRVTAAYYEYNKDYNALLDLCEKTNIEFNAPDFKTGSAISAITIRRLWALIQAGRLDECIKIGKRGMEKEPSGSMNWYFLAHYTLKALLYKGNYTLAIELINQVVNNPRFEKIGENFKEIFYTTLGYLHLVMDSGIYKELNSLKNQLPEFKLGKYLNTTPVFSKDKRGINVSILLMHIGFLLQRQDYNSIIDRIDSLNQYAYRYLRKDDSFRSNCVIKMVIQMARADFNSIRTERYTSELKMQLVQVNLAGSGENIEIEIVPFEILWKIMSTSIKLDN